MTVDVGDVVRVVAEFDMPDGTIAQLVYHFVGKSGSSIADSALITPLRSALYSAWAEVDQEISDQVLGSTFELFLWDFVLNRFDGIGATVLTVADGTNVGEMLPHGAAGLVKIFTVAARRQARKYIMGLVETVQDEGTIAGATVTKLADFAALLDNDVTAGTLTLAFGTFNTDPLSPLFETFSQASQTVQAEAVFAYQRRRRPGTGI